MQGYEVNFKIYAESEDEAKDVSKMFQEFVESHRQAGRAVTATKLKDAMAKLNGNFFFKNEVNKFLK